MRTSQLGASLVAANGSTIRTFRKRTITLCFTMKQYRWDFVITEVSHPLLGADFLWAISLLVDLRGNYSWIPKPIFLLRFVKQEPRRSTSAQFPQPGNEYDKLLTNFLEMTRPYFHTAHQAWCRTLHQNHRPSYPRTGSSIASRQVSFGQGRVAQNGSHGDYTSLK